MAVFQDVTLSWNDAEYVIPADNVMRLIVKIEDQVRLSDLADGKSPPIARIASAYAVALNHAGARVTADQVYASMFADGADVMAIMSNAVTTLLMLMTPPTAYQPAVDGSKKKAVGTQA